MSDEPKTPPDETKADMPDFEVISTSSPLIRCDNGHPRIYLKIEARGFVICPYCSIRYQLNGPGFSGDEGFEDGDDLSGKEPDNENQRNGSDIP